MATENLNTILNKIAEKGDLRQQGGAIAVNEFENFSSEDEEYLPNMPYHLAQAGWDDDLHKVLRDETEEGSNNWWYQFRESKGQTADYLTDVNYAWELANDVAFDRYPSLTIALQCRYALITSSVKSLGGNIPAKLVAALVEKQVWNPAQALAYIQHDTRQVQEENKLTEVLKEIAPYLDQSMFPDALEVVQKIVDERYREEALTGLATGLAPRLVASLFPAALEIAQEIQDENYRAYALSGLAPYLPPSLLSKALQATQTIQSDIYRVQALTGLAPHLLESEPLLSEALKTAKQIQSEDYQAKALSELAPYLSSYLLSKALEAARGIQDRHYRADALTGLAPYLPEVIPEALEAARKIQDQHYRAKALTGLAPYLPEVIPETLEAVQGIEDVFGFRLDALTKLAPFLDLNLLPKALEVARSLKSEEDQADALRAIASHLPKVVPEALKATLGIQDERNRVQAMSELVPYLSPYLLSEALKAAQKIQDEYYRAEALRELASYLPPSFLSEALEAAKRIQDEGNRAYALSGFAFYQPELLTKALEAARKISSEFYRAEILKKIVSKLPESFLPEVLKAVQRIQDERYRAEALSELASYLPLSLLPKALEVARSFKSEKDQVDAFKAIASYLPEASPEALKAVQRIQDDHYRAEALRELVPLVTNLPPSLLPEALKAVQRIQDDHYQAETLKKIMKIASHLSSSKPLGAAVQTLQENEEQSESLKNSFLKRAKIPNEDYPAKFKEAGRMMQDMQNWYIKVIAPGMPASSFPEAFKFLQEIQSERERAKNLNEIALHAPVPESLLPQALEVVRGIQDNYFRAYALSGLISQLKPSFVNFKLWKEMLHILAVRNRKDLLADISALSSIIIALGGLKALEDTMQAIQDVGQWWP